MRGGDFVGGDAATFCRRLRADTGGGDGVLLESVASSRVSAGERGS